MRLGIRPLLLCNLLSALLFLGSCDDNATQEKTQIITPLPVPEKAPEDSADSFLAPLLELLDSQISTPVQNKQVANLAYVLIKDGTRVAEGYHGTRTLDGDEAVNDKTIYRIYSMTKPVTATAMMILYEEGKFELDDPITKFLPELDNMRVYDGRRGNGQIRTHAAPRAPTMRELLTHTAGFGYGDGKRDYVNELYRDRQVQASATSDQLVQRVSQIPLMYDPGTSWSYSIASDLQGAIIERITGQPLEAFFKARILDPLGMVDTGFSVDETQRPRLAVLTSWTPETGMQLVPGKRQDMVAGTQRQAGGHGLVSTITDYERFAKMLLNDGSLDDVTILKPETVQLMRTNALNFVDEDTNLPEHEPFRGVGYGYGLGVVTGTIRSGLAAPKGTCFWDGATGTWFWIDPTNDIIFIGMIQNMGPTGINLRPLAMQRVYHAFLGNTFPQKSDVTTSMDLPE